MYIFYFRKGGGGVSPHLCGDIFPPSKQYIRYFCTHFFITIDLRSCFYTLSTAPALSYRPCVLNMAPHTVRQSVAHAYYNQILCGAGRKYTDCGARILQFGLLGEMHMRPPYVPQRTRIKFIETGA